MGPYIMAFIFGPKGSCKTVLSELLKGLIDPGIPITRSLPKDEENLMVAAENSHCLVFDNVSHLPSWLPDALCRLLTGGGYGVRRHYTHKEQAVFQLRRPIVLNGIEEGALCRSDLADRTIYIEMQAVPDEERIEESEWRRRFNEYQPRIFGCVLDLLASGLKHRNSVRPAKLLRMADFARFMAGIEGSLGLRSGEFMEIYQRNMGLAAGVSIDNCLLLPSIRTLVSICDWEGTASDLLVRLSGSPEMRGIRRHGRVRQTSYRAFSIGWRAI
jgi:hypothetical protein